MKLSFREYRYRDLVPPVEWPDNGVRLAALVFALGRERFTLHQMSMFYGQKYEITDLGHTLFALTYFDDAEQDETPELLWRIEWDEVKAAVEGWVKDYTQKQAPPQSEGRGIRP